MKIYRLETVELFGPYVCPKNRDRAVSIQHFLIDHKCPMDYGRFREVRRHRGGNFLTYHFESPDWVFAWDSIETARVFIKGGKRQNFKDLSDHYDLFWNVYEVSTEHCEVFHDGQVVFDRTKAISVEYNVDIYED